MSDVTRLFLITPPVADAAAFAPLLQAALAAADVACVLLRAAAVDDTRAAQDALAVLVPIVQRAGAAALVERDSRLAARLGADGVHIEGAEDALDEALAALKPDGIVGVGALAGRDDAMRAGEQGADYLMFGRSNTPQSHEEIGAQVEWWAEIFNVPCVGYAADPGRAGEMAVSGAEFVALCQGVWDHPERIATILGAAHRAVSRQPEPAR